MSDNPFGRWQERRALTTDAAREEAVARRHAKGYRTARENLYDLIDSDSFIEYGQLAIAAQRARRPLEELQRATPADGVLTGQARINSAQFGAQRARTVVVINDYTVLAGTQGYFHHQKLDRILQVAHREALPVVMYTEGGGGRPGDVDVSVQMAGLNTTAFAEWGRLHGQVPRIAVNNGYCFAGNAALFGAADVSIATRTSWIGMAGPAMIEGGGLGQFAPTDIGPIEQQARNGVVDLVAEDEAHATLLAQHVLGYWQGSLSDWQAPDQLPLRDVVPNDRRWAFKVRDVIERVADVHSFLELRGEFAPGIVTGFMRVQGHALGVLANSAVPLGGAIDAVAADKACEFMQLCERFRLPLVAFTDTPGFMVGPDSEREGAVRRMSRMFNVGATLTVPTVTVILRKGYGLGAMAMSGGSFVNSNYTVSWPSGEFGGMGLEGAVKLGFRKELDAAPAGAEREALFDRLVKQLYEQGQATEAAAYLEIDAVIDPAQTRDVLANALGLSG